MVKPAAHEEEEIDGVLHHRIRPSCHPHANDHGFVRGPSPLSEGVTRTPSRSDTERVSGFSPLD